MTHTSDVRCQVSEKPTVTEWTLNEASTSSTDIDTPIVLCQSSPPLLTYSVPASLRVDVNVEVDLVGDGVEIVRSIEEVQTPTFLTCDLLTLTCD